MSAVIETKPTAAPRIVEHTTLTAVTLESSIPFANETSSVRLGGINNNCDSITPARLDPAGSAVAIEKGQVASGLLLRRKCFDRTKGGAEYIEQCYVPMGNVKCLQYSAAPVKPS